MSSHESSRSAFQLAKQVLLLAGLTIGMLHIQAQSCGGLDEFHTVTDKEYDLDGDGFSDFILHTERGRRLQSLTQPIDCVIDEFHSVSLIPIHGTEVRSRFDLSVNGQMPVSFPLGTALGEELGGRNPAAVFLHTKVGPVLIAFEDSKGPLALPTGGVAYLALRLPGYAGMRNAWIKMSAGPECDVLDSAVQANNETPLLVGIKPQPPGDKKKVVSKSVDTDGDGAVDLFVVRTTTHDPESGAEEIQVSLSDLGNGEVLSGLRAEQWPAGEYAASFQRGYIVNPFLPPSFQWKPIASVGPIWARKAVGGIETQRWGPCSRAGQNFIAVRRANGLLVVLEMNELGECISMDSVGAGAIVAGTKAFIEATDRIVDRSALDLDRDGVADFIALTSDFMDYSNNGSVKRTKVRLHAFGVHRMGVAFGPPALLTLPANPAELAALPSTTVLRLRELDLAKDPVVGTETAVSKDHVLPLYLNGPEGTRLGWLAVDAQASPLAWRAGLATGPNQPLMAGENPLQPRLTLTYRKEGSNWVTDVAWSDFSHTSKLFFANQIGDTFQAFNPATASQNVTMDRQDGWVDRTLTIPATALRRFYLIR